MSLFVRNVNIFLYIEGNDKFTFESNWKIIDKIGGHVEVETVWQIGPISRIRKGKIRTVF